MDKKDIPEKLRKEEMTQIFSEPSVQDKSIEKINYLAITLGTFGLLGFVLFHFLYWQGFLAIPSLLLFTLAPLFGVITLVLVIVKHKKLKGWSYPIGAIFILGFLSIWLIPSISCAMQRHMSKVCTSNLQKLGMAITEYARKHNGYLPAANRWCDLLIESDRSLSKDTFKCPAAKEGICNYAFNESLENLRLADVPRDVVLLYEANGDWNLKGGPELLELRHSGGKICFTLFANGSVGSYGVKFPFNQPLRWKP